MKKTYGEGSFRPSSGQTDARRIPTGIFQLDYHLLGGVPVNRVTLICGHKASFKTTLALKIIKHFQERCTICYCLPSACHCIWKEEDKPSLAVYIDAEHALDEGHVKRLGVDPSRLYIAEPPHAEAACEYTEKLAKVPDVGLIVVDCLAALMPSAEADADYLDGISRGARAKLIARMLRACIVNIKRERPCTLLLLNHLLPRVDGRPGDILPGGETQKYLSSVVLKLWVIGKSQNKIDVTATKKRNKESEEEIFSDEEEDTKRKQTVGFLIEHSKVSPENITGEYELCLQEGPGFLFGDADDDKVIFLWALKLGYIEKVGAVYHTNFSDIKFTSQKAIFEFWHQEPAVFTVLRDQIIQAGKAIF